MIILLNKNSQNWKKKKKRENLSKSEDLTACGATFSTDNLK